MKKTTPILILFLISIFQLNMALAEDNDGRPSSAYGCRDQYVVFLADGVPNSDLRPCLICTGSEANGYNCPIQANSFCPIYDIIAQIIAGQLLLSSSQSKNVITGEQERCYGILQAGIAESLKELSGRSNTIDNPPIPTYTSDPSVINITPSDFKKAP